MVVGVVQGDPDNPLRYLFYGAVLVALAWIIIFLLVNN